MLAIEKEYISTHNVLGNVVLYKLCEQYPLGCEEKGGYTKENALAAQSWLIGRSYAASPQRRHYGEIKINFTQGANGLDDFFDILAEKLYANREFYDGQSDSFVSKINSIRNLKYSFIDKDLEQDIVLLSKSIKYVLGFNKLLRKAIAEIDRKDLEKVAADMNLSFEELRSSLVNYVSFSSKFLHFHFPDVIFIIDSISYKHFKIKGKKEYDFTFKDGKGSQLLGTIKISKIEINRVLSILGNYLTLDELDSNYCIHCAREYLLAKKLYELAEDKTFGGKSITRLTDIYIMNANR